MSQEFVHEPYRPGETIAAVATPPGDGGVAIVRISGDNALITAAQIFSGPIHSYVSHTAHYGRIQTPSGEKIDDGLALIMRAPRSYTGEETVEIMCHGGHLVTRRVLDAALSAGARAARPGEFTFRAFMNGRLDLSQAEAVQELIGAKNQWALQVAEGQLEGRLSRLVENFQERLTHLAAILEAWVDFPDEGLEFTTFEEMVHDLNTLQTEIQHLINTYHEGRILHEGISICLIGCPNVGKSSLMNALLDKERAIVSPLPGTTRDLVEDHVRLSGLNVKLIDTAGIREGADWIEREGIRRSRLAMEKADLILFILDASAHMSEEDRVLLHELPPAKTIAIWNKIDLPHTTLPPLLAHTLQVSAETGEGIETLKSTIDQVIWKEGPPSREEVVITNVRHQQALEKAAQAIGEVAKGLNTGVSPEFLTLEMRSGLSALGQIMGTNIGEDILSAIFSTFCIGK